MDSEATLLSHYNLNTLFPTEWPADKDEEDALNEESTEAKYTSLHRGSSVRYSVPGAQKSRTNVESLVQKDEADPLGSSASIVQVLRQRGLPVEDNFRLRNRFLLSSTTFSPSLYLAEVHQTASTQELLQGLDFLSRSIEEKSASLKVLVESNFERFVKAKSTIDNVYNEMRQPKGDNDAEKLKADRSSRQFGRPGMSLRSASNVARPQPSGVRSKNALTKESEYGLAGIKTPLVDATLRAEEIWAPAFGGRQREENLRSVLTAIEKNAEVLEAGARIDEGIKKRDYTQLADQYAKASKHAVEAKMTADRAQNNQMQLSEDQIQQILITSRVWTDIQKKVDEFKDDTWKRLRSPDSYQGKDEHIELISILLQLGVDENPIPAWLQSRQEHLKERITTTFEQARIELEIQRRRLASFPKPLPSQIAFELRKATYAKTNAEDAIFDSQAAIRFWQKIIASLETLLNTRTGILAEVLDFASSLSSVIDGKLQRSLPAGLEGRSRKHHKLDATEVRQLEDGVLRLFAIFKNQIHAFFVEAPLQDMSALFEAAFDTAASNVASPKRSRLGIRSEDVPAVSAQSGEFWESCAFWPPHGNSLAGSAYMSKIVNLVAAGASEIGSNEFGLKDEGTLAQLRNLISDMRERSIKTICAAWYADAESCRELEDWTRSPEKKDLTNLPAYFDAYEGEILDNLHSIIQLRIAQSMVIPPSPPQHVDTVHKALKQCLYKSFTGIMENAANPPQKDASTEELSLVAPSIQATAEDTVQETINVTNVNVRKLLTMSNFQCLRSEIVPKLIGQFESKFNLSMTDDAKAFRDVLGQMNARVFQAYVRPTTDALRLTITNGIISPVYAPTGTRTRPSDAKTYVYDVLLALVIMHTEISSTTPSLTNQILSYMLEQISSALLHSFKQRQRYTLAALMQATLDVEFTAQTLNNYTTEKASEIQGQIYLALDERTDNEARLSLQQELPEMRAILKRLREGTKGEFMCFKRERKGRSGAAGEGRERVKSPEGIVKP